MGTKGRPPLAKESTIVSVCIPLEVVRRIDAIAVRRGMKRAAIIRELIEMGLDRTSASVEDLQTEVDRISAALKKMKGNT